MVRKLDAESMTKRPASKRKIVHIDEELCDGCGQCVPACAEGALKIIDGKARLVSDVLCDGIGDCLGHCPQNAIRIEERECLPFDEEAVEAARKATPTPAPHTGCPSARLMDFGANAPTPTPTATDDDTPAQPSRLRHWPIQLHLLPLEAPFLAGADLLLCATCVPVSFPDFQSRVLDGRSVAIACPKLDNQTGYLEKLTHILATQRPRSLTVARMSVPCCGGLLMLALEARDRAGSDLTIHEMVIAPDGQMMPGREHAAN